MRKQEIASQIVSRPSHGTLKCRAGRAFRESWLAGGPVFDWPGNLFPHFVFAIFLVSRTLASNGELGEHDTPRRGAVSVPWCGLYLSARVCGRGAPGAGPLDSPRQYFPFLCGDVVYLRTFWISCREVGARS